MRLFALPLAALLAAAALAPARGQPVTVPAAPGYPIQPPASNSPLQQQMLRNYRSDLQQTQRELSARNPSGLSREQLDVRHRLNAVDSALAPAPTPPAPTPSAPAAPFGGPLGAPLGSPFGTPLGASQPMPVR
ncbi:MAG: hypothetical protein AB7H71_04985 [Alphaproteobacteria bacterium]